MGELTGLVPVESHRAELVEVYDVCCGKGFFSMLLAYVAPRFPPLSHIAGITMLDKSGIISQTHLKVAQRDAFEEVCLPIRYLQADIHDNQLARKLYLLDAKDQLDKDPLQFEIDVVNYDANVEDREVGAPLDEKIDVGLNNGDDDLQRIARSRLKRRRVSTLLANDKARQGRKVILVGIHLCKRLSARLALLFSELVKAEAMVLR